MINDDYVSFSALKYPKIIYVKCLDTGKVYKAEKKEYDEYLNSRN